MAACHTIARDKWDLFDPLTRGQKCPDNRCMDMDALRESLKERRGDWTRLAEAAALSRKTIQRIVHDPTYNPTLATFSALARVLAESRARAA